jgi:hypothetical protein
MQAVGRDAIEQWLVWLVLQPLQVFKRINQGVTDPQKSMTMHLVGVIPFLIQRFSLNSKMAFKSLKASIKSGPVLLPPAVGQADGEHLKVLGLPTFFEILGRPKGQLGNSRF